MNPYEVDQHYDSTNIYCKSDSISVNKVNEELCEVSAFELFNSIRSM